MKKHIWIGVGLMLVAALLVITPFKENYAYYENTPITKTVTIKGAVQKPGSYTVTPDMTLAYLIELAGGLTISANISDLNLGQTLVNDVYDIPSHEVKIDPIVKKINLNEAGFNDLIQIPNITESRALEILIYKKSIGQFKALEELLNVKGIGPATFEKIKIYFYI